MLGGSPRVPRWHRGGGCGLRRRYGTRAYARAAAAGFAGNAFRNSEGGASAAWKKWGNLGLFFQYLLRAAAVGEAVALKGSLPEARAGPMRDLPRTAEIFGRRTVDPYPNILRRLRWGHVTSSYRVCSVRQAPCGPCWRTSNRRKCRLRPPCRPPVTRRRRTLGRGRGGRRNSSPELQPAPCGRYSLAAPRGVNQMITTFWNGLVLPRTIRLRPLSRWVTRAKLGRGRVLCAAVKLRCRTIRRWTCRGR